MFMSGIDKYTLKKYLSDRQFRRVRYLVNTSKVFRQFMFPASRATCNICNYNGRFRPFGQPPRYGAECISCGSFERHRLLKLWWDANKESLRGARVLHFAPESSVQQFVKHQVREYHSADLEPGRAELALSIEKTGLPSESYDLIICLHVLEHVDDRRALLELRRILARDGTLIIMVPVVEGWDTTYENSAIVRPAERTVHFGQWNHVRTYGRDLRDRISKAGFQLEEVTAGAPLMFQHGLLAGEKVFVCRK
jgi:SAM-dependent methyltransferase